MSNSYALPILRTADLSEALRAVDGLLGIADLTGLEIDYEALISSPATLERLLGLLPRATWYAKGDEDASKEAGDDPAAHLPIRWSAWAESPETVPGFLAALNGTPATVRWDFMGWPPAPEVGLGYGGTRGAFVTLCVNVHDLELKTPAADHMVYVHVKQIEAERAPWLAEQVGLRVIGDMVEAPD
ncbi:MULTISPECIES: hypothetical protein [unclassified Streptomyces]|uniref:hypothetical protein n=1 Tax=unclassified Streptomyces TaxID=2593676 RepID=UPI002E2BB118|nr:hypothetical protein [Streptomyces sp. NBC_01423]WSX92416.1 hypothetical protein OH827_18610 [Streptomyces sp. NBC_00891]WSY06893.1 hypothetical protein OG464_18610 [Streptomyces sp. NBC_00890]WSZ08519.1 hypothetical protein OG704_18610 [Streptomyces sp. NBC_00869]WSZ23982.1 hypothetical protein OG498_14955 [Streptomyces sp. NBC_00870]